MNSQAFGGLHSLRILNLESNKCIDKEFRFIGVLTAVRKTVKENCGYCEIDVEELVELNITVERKMQEIDKKNSEINDKNEKIKILEEKIELLSKVNSKWGRN